MSSIVRNNKDQQHFKKHCGSTTMAGQGGKIGEVKSQRLSKQNNVVKIHLIHKKHYSAYHNFILNICATQNYEYRIAFMYV